MLGQYHIEVPAFSGPFDLLLHLIERNELDITAISLAQVSEQYLTQVEQLKLSQKQETLIDFIVIGARLVLIKSRALLPHNPAATLEEEEEDPAETLARQLREYKQFKEAAHWLQNRHEHHLRTFLRVAPPPKIETHLNLSGITPHTLQQLLQTILERPEKSEPSTPLTQPRRVTIEGQLALLRQTISHTPSFWFADLLSPERSQVEVCITLLAALELIKRGELAAQQSELFSPILLHRLPS